MVSRDTNGEAGAVAPASLARYSGINRQ
jgi:hypothetical protein